MTLLTSECREQPWLRFGDEIPHEFNCPDVEARPDRDVHPTIFRLGEIRPAHCLFEFLGGLSCLFWVLGGVGFDSANQLLPKVLGVASEGWVGGGCICAVYQVVTYFAAALRALPGQLGPDLWWGQALSTSSASQWSIPLQVLSLASAQVGRSSGSM
jgi:hypothetical protein